MRAFRCVLCLLALISGCSSQGSVDGERFKPSAGGGGAGGNPGGSGGASTHSGGSAQTSGGSGNAGGGAGGSAGSSGTSAGGTGAGGAGAGSLDARQMVADLGFGTNIGNTLENTASWETGWGQPEISREYIDGMASRGIKTVRVPVAWDTYAVGGEIEPSKMNRVKEVVGWIEDAGMYSIVNIHWDGGWIDNSPEGNPNRYQLTADVQAKFASYWTQIASAFSAVGHKLIFEGLNEESQFYVNGDTENPNYAALNTLNQLFVTTVRAQPGYNATRALLIAGFKTDIALTCVDEFQVPDDPAGANKLFLSIHYYTPFDFSLQDAVASWGPPRTTWGTPADEEELQDLFDQLYTFSTQRDIPVILGEFAVTPGDDYPREPASRVLWMTAVANAALARDMVPVLWDTGSEISREDGSFSPTFQSVWDDLDH